jgi:hypothetical protein
LLYSFPTYGEAGGVFDECLINLSEIQCLSARLPPPNGLVSLRFSMKGASLPLFCSVPEAEYLALKRMLAGVLGEVTIDENGCIHYASEEAHG